MGKKSIELVAAGVSLQPDRLGGGGVTLRCDVDGRTQVRELGFRFGYCSSQVASLRAARLALFSVLVPSGDIRLIVDRYVFTMLESVDSKYRATPSANLEDVIRLRAAYERCGRPELVSEKPTGGLATCVALAKASAMRQANSDSGTYERGTQT